MKNLQSAPAGYATAPASYAAPPQPVYTNQIVEPQPQVVQPVNAYPTGKHKVYAHGVKGLKNVKTEDEYLLETEGYRRLRRDTEAAFDPKCNSEALKDIILKNIAESTASSKRRIQEAATDELGGRIDVICSSGTFSYIVNTELYCETEKNGITCFAFRQAS
ncbi:ground-like domain protein [Oesophagostomum dentatum]|uniref:Ground-like domain protein n=1 Tax=Oesophagostomum dentatum TaxID=61180 RepID=A0A0B1SKY1_OESDE|nr:ground-like domain protein [Oesophagostomum dentatum]